MTRRVNIKYLNFTIMGGGERPLNDFQISTDI